MLQPAAAAVTILTLATAAVTLAAVTLATAALTLAAAAFTLAAATAAAAAVVAITGAAAGRSVQSAASQCTSVAASTSVRGPQRTAGILLAVALFLPIWRRSKARSAEPMAPRYLG